MEQDKRTFPRPTCTIAVLSILNLIWFFFAFFTALETSLTTVPCYNRNYLKCIREWHKSVIINKWYCIKWCMEDDKLTLRSGIKPWRLRIFPSWWIGKKVFKQTSHNFDQSNNLQEQFRCKDLSNAREKLWSRETMIKVNLASFCIM